MSKKPHANKSKGSSSAQDPKKAKRKPGDLSRFQKTVIVLFVIVFALSTLAGALASVFQSQQAGQTIEYNVDYVDEQYSGLISDLEGQLAENPDDMDTVLALANDYSSWGASVRMLATTDEESSHADDLLDTAIGYYDQYLASENPESEDSARVSRAMCLYYQGSVDDAIEALEGVTKDSPDYATGWADLGLVYESQGRSDDAIAAYEKAVELDPNDEQGVKSSVEERLEALKGAGEQEGEKDADSDASTETDADSSTDSDAADGEQD